MQVATSTGLVFINFGFIAGKRAGRGALKLLKRPARFCGCLISERRVPSISYRGVTQAAVITKLWKQGNRT